MTEYIKREDAIQTLEQMQWHDEDGFPIGDGDEKRACAEDWINCMSTINIVHCGECKWWEYPAEIQGLSGKTDHIGKCTQTKWLCGEAGYCMYGERKSDD